MGDVVKLEELVVCVDGFRRSSEAGRGVGEDLWKREEEGEGINKMKGRGIIFQNKPLVLVRKEMVDLE